jgi:hypothetical protein
MTERRWRTPGTSLAIFMVLFIGCKSGETNRALFKRYEGQFAAKRQQFNAIARTLPAPGSAQASTAASLSPKPVYGVRESDNTEIVMYDQLVNPDIKSDGNNRLDLILSGKLLTPMQWTGPKNPMSSEALDKKSVPDMEASLNKSLTTRYLVVVRPVQFVAPVATSEDGFQAGFADLEAFVVDLQNNNIAASGRFLARSSAKVEFMFKKGEDKKSRLESFAYSSLFTDARQKLGALLPQITGGQFVLDK